MFQYVFTVSTFICLLGIMAWFPRFFTAAHQVPTDFIRMILLTVDVNIDAIMSFIQVGLSLPQCASICPKMRIDL